MNVKEKIKQALREAGLTQTALAEKLGVKHPVVSAWITGRRNPSVNTLKKLAEALGKDYKYFYEDTSPAQKLSDILNSGLAQENKSLSLKERFSIITPGNHTQDYANTAPVCAIAHCNEVIFTQDIFPLKAKEQARFTVKIADNQYYPVLKAGDLLIFDTKLKKKNNNIVIYSLDGQYLIGMLKNNSVTDIASNKKVNSAKVLAYALFKSI